MSAWHSQGTDTRTLTILAFSATAGALIEFYDFFICGYAAATAFPAIFFPKLPPTQALVFSYLAFGAAFPARLIGAFLFGHFGDRTGRKFSFLLSIAIVGGTTCLTGLLPGYAKLGIVAPVLLVVFRVVQGIGIGGEFGGTSSLLAEFGAERRSRAFLDVSGESWHPLRRHGGKRRDAGHEQDVRDNRLADRHAGETRKERPRRSGGAD
jgi:MHS family shikimate/dehydroshikimate transporter-like MFS transporter